MIRFLFLYAVLAIGCRQNSTISDSQHATEQVSYSPVATPAEQATLHTDTAYRYEFRTGASGNYKYNYDVVGTDDYGNMVTGNVSMQGKYGAGILLNGDGNEVEITLEWVGYGKLRAEDDEGNFWDLEVE